MPPTHCVVDRQNRIPRGMEAGSVRIEAPVVVNPDAVSKNALVIEGIAPLKR
jgi:hypothetical protein